MKKPMPQLVTSALIVSAIALASPMSVRAQAGTSTVPSQAPATTNVSGKIETKTSTSLTVSGRTILLNSSTTYSKDGTAIGSSDLKVGQKVDIVTANNGQVAIAVIVTSSD